MSIDRAVTEVNIVHRRTEHGDIGSRMKKEENMIRKDSSSSDLIARLVVDTLQLGGDGLEVEYKDGYESVCAMRGNVGVEIASLPSSGEDACELRKRLLAMTRKRETISIQGNTWILRAKRYDSFGEAAFSVSIHEK